ncbi:MAG: sugar phosphate isomerase/epimerase [Bryobacteraceae bacterium]|jgi:sugar phosphate isomerase/epimerase
MLGIATTSYINGDPIRDAYEFLEHAHSLGAAGIQAPPVGDLPKIRDRANNLGMFVEAIIPLSSFEKGVQNAKAMGATCVRVNAGGRRYEDFSTLADFENFKTKALAAIAVAVPIAEKYKIPLAIENHKDWTPDQQIAIFKSYSSEYLGACLDFGNNIALCEDPMEVAQKLAPYTITTHVKDMGVEPYADGFLLSELRLGDGFLDLKKIISLLRPGVHLNLEMITRDPLKIPCLTPRYWATFPDVKADQLARALHLVQQHAQKLPRVSQLPREALLRVMEENNRACLDYARANL